MKIDNFKYMNRQADDTQVGTRLLINGKIRGNGTRIEKLPGYAIKVTGRDIVGGGEITFDKVFVFKDSRHSYATQATFFALSNNKLYWWSGTEWHEVDWEGIDPAYFDEARFWYDRGTLHISGGAEGRAAVYQYIDRDPAAGNGYFNNQEGYVGFWFGQEELPQFTAKDNIVQIQTINSNYRASAGGWVKGNGLLKNKGYYVMGQFICSNGQESIVGKDSYLGFIDTTCDVSASANIRICISANDFSKRIEAIDIYVASSEELLDVSGELGDVDESTLQKLDWRFLRRVDINNPYVILSTQMKFAVPTTHFYFYYDTNIIATNNDMTVTCFHGNELFSGLYWLYYRPVGESEDWQRVQIKSMGNMNLGASLPITQYVEVVSSISGVSKVYDASIVGKWKHYQDGIPANGIVQIYDSTAIAGKTVTVNGTVFTEGTEWSAGANNEEAAGSLASAINSAAIGCTAYPKGFGVVTDGLVYLVADTAGTAGNNISLSTNAAETAMVVSNDHFEGGKDGDYYVIDVPWRFGMDYPLDTSDPFEAVQAYSVINEYYPQSKFAATQDRRTFRLACKTNKEHQNMLLWSEPDKPQVVPNGNMILLNINSGEEPKGLVAIKNALLALFEKSVHYIRMTAEPVQYDAEEGKFEEGCIASRGIVVYNGVALWPGIDGIKIFTGEVKDLTTGALRDDYLNLIASEYAGNSNSYEGIVGAYSKKQNLIVWIFPNSTYTIGNLTVRALAYDIGKGFLFLELNKVFKWLFEGYEGELYGVKDDGIYELFADSPDENNRLVWESGVLSPGGMEESLLEKLALTYNGTPTIKLYVNRESTPVINEAWPAKTSVGQDSCFIQTMGREVQMKIESPSSTADEEIEKIEIKGHTLELVA